MATLLEQESDLLEQESEQQEAELQQELEARPGGLIMYPPLAPCHARYASVMAGRGAQPLRIVCELAENAPLAAYDPVHLDNVLARAVVEDATGGLGLPDSSLPYDLPVPLQCLWRSAAGLPLWASSCFFPVGDSAPDTLYLHKRAITGEYARANPKTGRLTLDTAKGRHMERRVPLPVTVCHQWEARAWGDPEQVLRLLSGIAFLGKRRGAGLGEVRQWRVEHGGGMGTAEEALAWEGALRRPVPEASLPFLPGVAVAQPPSLVGWTPPQWKPSLFEAGWPALTPVINPQ